MRTLEAAKQFQEQCNVAGRRRRSGHGRQISTWPRISDAAGVHPDQIPEAIEAAKKHGVSIDFTPGGEAIFSSRENERQYLELYGLKQNNGGYGDSVDQSKTIWAREGEDPSDFF